MQMMITMRMIAGGEDQEIDTQKVVDFVNRALDDAFERRDDILCDMGQVELVRARPMPDNNAPPTSS